MATKNENKNYLKEQIITYLGNKRSLLPYIEKEILQIQKNLKKDKTVNVDLFSGSGIVARLLKRYSSHLIANDLELYSQIVNKCYLMNDKDIDWDKYQQYFDIIESKIKNKDFIDDGIIYKNYAPNDDNNIRHGERVFYTVLNAKIIDTVRHTIESFVEPYKTLFLAQLITEASIKNNTAGVFKGFYKDSKTGIGKYGGNGEYALQRIKGKIEIKKPVLSNFECETTIYREDANELVKKIIADIVYIDPPYNQHPYGSNYFMLNLIATNEEPKEMSRVSGIPKNWNKSVYNVKSKARDEFDNLISNIKSKYIIVSYNSEGFITYDEMIEMLSLHGKLEIKEIVYNTYRGSRNLAERNLYVKEFLFVLEKE